MQDEGETRKLAAIMFTDMAGYSAWAQRRPYGADDPPVDASCWRAAPLSNACTRTCNGA